ncbi:hypothetical protein RMATCC62417_10941 [Rhizopus microsporus]|nr:hypothetical protein RMATCC62417_10941 [Rhizopus microsporus]
MDKENRPSFRLCGVYPGRGPVFTASCGKGNDRHDVRRVSTKEYYKLTGSIRHTKREVERMERDGIALIYQNLPSTKTASTTQYLSYTSYTVRNLDRLLDFNSKKTAAGRFHLYQGVQRARAEMANVLIDGGKKYNRNKRRNTRKNRRKRKKKAMRKKGKRDKKKEKGKKKEVDVGMTKKKMTVIQKDNPPLKVKHLEKPV